MFISIFQGIINIPAEAPHVFDTHIPLALWKFKIYENKKKLCRRIQMFLDRFNDVQGEVSLLMKIIQLFSRLDNI